MDIIQYNAGLGCSLLPDNVTEDDARLCRGDLDCRFDAVETSRREGMCRRPLDKFEISQGGKFNAEVLKGVVGLVDNENVWRRMSRKLSNGSCTYPA